MNKLTSEMIEKEKKERRIGLFGKVPSSAKSIRRVVSLLGPSKISSSSCMAKSQ